MRGTNKKVTVKVEKLIGSSPHTRDKLEMENPAPSNDGIIPAYAGQIKRDCKLH